ncbi:hypothetical protein ABZ135_18460 [Streptomyces sp. NPDC006339]|uniref:hypothetical protein n=1 Tax=Streptomyces sp. NPDC006339 TaxID=3156755 RepID=UPI0033AEAC55
MADDDTTVTPPAMGEQQPAPPAPGSEGGDLGDAGKKAITEERAARRAAEQARKELEARLKELEPLAAKAQQLEDAKKSEAEKLTEKLTAAEKRALAAEEKALRLEVATAKGLTPAQAKRLVGSTKDELEADADELLASFGGTPPADSSGKKPGRRPVEQLRPGGAPNPPAPSLAEQIAAAEKARNWAEASRLKTIQLMQMANPNQ